MAEKKVKTPTLKEMYDKILQVKEIQENKELYDFIVGRKELVEKKNASGKDNAEKSKFEKELTEKIIEELSTMGRVTVTEFISKCSQELKDFYITNSGKESLTNQKVTSVLRPLVENGQILKTPIKGYQYYETI